MTDDPHTEHGQDDGQHDFVSATVDADDDQIVDDQGHVFTRGRLADHDGQAE